MLKKFNILFEEILDDVKLNRRFKKASKILADNLSKSEKQALNEKYNELTKSVLKEFEGSDNPVIIHYFSGPNSYARNLANIKEVKDDVVIWVGARDLEKAERITPVEDFLINDVYDKILDDEEEFLKNLEEKKKKVADEIYESASPELKYLIDKGYIKALDIVKGITSSEPHDSYTLTIGDDKIFEDKKVLEIFNVDVDSDKFKRAKTDSTYGPEAWYYGGRLRLFLKVIMKISEGLPLDPSRIKDIKYEYVFEGQKGVGTKGEF